MSTLNWLLGEERAITHTHTHTTADTLHTPSLSFVRYGLPWAFPGWLDPKSTSTVKADANQFMGESNLTQIAEYVVEWVKGAKDHHGLHIDYVGKWNEKAVPDAYPVALRKVLDDNGLSSTEIVGGGLRGSGVAYE